MNEEELKKIFADAARQSSSDTARQRARRDALAAFDEEFSQGNATPVRPTEDKQTPWRNIMSANQYVLSGMASAAVVVLAVLFVFNVNNISTLPVLPAIEVSEPPAAAATNTRAIEEVIVAATRSEADQSSSIDLKREERTAAPARERFARLKEQEAAFTAGDNAGYALGNPAPLSLAKSQANDAIAPVYPPEVGRDSFSGFDTGQVSLVSKNPVSTFSIDVDTASYSFIRRQLNQGILPQKAAVRLEEMVNYFPYNYPAPESADAPFAASISIMDSPWNSANKLVHIGIKGYEKPIMEDIRSNIVFLLDVSGSMNQPDKLPLVKQSMNLLLSKLQPEDTVAIVVYAGAAGTVLEPTPVSEKQKILSAMNRLQAGGSTAGAAGIRLAYQLAEANYIEDGINRVFLATDGDFNVGITSRDELKGFVERKRESGVYLSVLGFGQGNYQDDLMQKLAQNGNGIAAYIDTLSEAQKVLVDEATSMLFPIANDVKLQVEFNPATVSEYRLLGYETRMLATEDFNNDKVDAGEIGAGHTVTAIYEITPVGEKGLLEGSRYGQQAKSTGGRDSEYGFLKMRYKLPGENASRLIEQAIPVQGAGSTTDSRFAVAVAGFAQLLKNGKYVNDWGYEDAMQLAVSNKGDDTFGYRAEFTQLIRKAMTADTMR